MYNKYHRFSLALIVSLTLTSLAHSSDFPDEEPSLYPAPVLTNSNYTRAQAVKILDEYFDALFAKHRYYGANYTNFELFKNNTILFLLQNRITFGPDEIEQLKSNICSAAVTHIETHAREYAEQVLNQNRHLIANTFATRDQITRTISNEVSKIITSNYRTGKLHDYFGTNLQNKVNELITTEIRKLAQPARPQPRPQPIIQPAPRPTPVYDANAEFAAANRMLSDYLDSIFSASYISNQAEFKAFKSSTIAQIVKNRTIFSPSTYNDLQGNAKQLSLTYITNKTKEYTNARLNQNSHIGSSAINTISYEIIEKITNEAENIVIYETNLAGKLYSYFGSNLQNKVNILVDQKIRLAVPQPRPTQPTPAPAGPVDYNKDDVDCNVCFEEYDITLHTRIILECGHSLCKSCIKTMANRGEYKCPSCRRENVIKLAAARLR